MKTTSRTVRTVLFTAAGLLAFSVPGGAFEEGSLLIWINGDKGYRGLQQVGDKFAEELGVPVRVEAPEGATDKFQQAAQSGKGPDIFFWPHDRLGEWADAGLLRPIEPAASYKEQFYPKAWEAFTHNGRIWAYPVSLEAVGLIYNKELVQGEVPKTLEEIRTFDAKLKEQGADASAILWDYNNTYFTWGILASNGAYVFGRDGGEYDTTDIGVNTPGGKEALEIIVKMVEDNVMPRGASYSVMEAKMNNGELAMMISGPWAWANLRRSGIDFGVATVPGVKGNTGKPFVGVLGGMINRASPNADLAKEFLENYLLTPEGLALVDADVPLGVPAHKGFAEKLAAEDPLIKASITNVDNGVLMPNVPEMGRFWSAMGAALSNATNGQTDVGSALDLAAQRILPRALRNQAAPPARTKPEETTQ